MGKKYFNKNKMQTAKLQSKISTQLMRKDGQRHKKKSCCEEKNSKFAAWQWQIKNTHRGNRWKAAAYRRVHELLSLE